MILRCVALLAALSSVQASAQRPALRTDGAATIGRGRIEIGAGVEYLTRSAEPFPGAPVSVWRVPTFTARWGAASNVDLEFEWSGRLLAGYAGGADGSDWGDPVIGTVVTAVEEGESLPAIGLRTAVKIPSTSFLPYYLGSDQTDVTFAILATRHLGRVEARLNIGLGILGNPRELGSQDDVYIVGAAVLVPVGEQWRLFAEGYGMSGYKSDDDKLLVRSGMTAEFGSWGLRLFAGVRVAGSGRDFGAAFLASEDWSAGVSCAKEFSL